MSAAHGGQSLLTQSTCDLLQNALPGDVTLHEMGEHRLKDLRTPLQLYQVNTTDLPRDFPPIKSLDIFSNNLPIQLTSFVGRKKKSSRSRRCSIRHACDSHRFRRNGQVASPSKSAAKSLLLYRRRLAHRTCDALGSCPNYSCVRPGFWSAGSAVQYTGKSCYRFILRDKQLLIILDNCEHLIAACRRASRMIYCINARTQDPCQQPRSVGHRGGSCLSHAPPLQIPNRHAFSWNVPALPIRNFR